MIIYNNLIYRMLGQIIRYKSKNEKVYYIIIEINENNYVLYNPLYKRKSTINKLDKELLKCKTEKKKMKN